MSDEYTVQEGGSLTTESSRVLVVDDDPMMGAFLAAILEEIASIQVVASGEAALDLLKTENFDVVLLDVDMPGLGGLATCQAIKTSSATSHVSVIVVTAHTGNEIEIEALDLGATDFIVKPFVAKVVLARVRNHLIMQAQARELRILSITDGLTGIANRRCFDQTLKNEWNRAGRKNNSLSLLLIDVDKFKKYNDHYGHSLGDDCLKKIAGALKQSVKRAGDLVARVGGEEFAIILPYTKKEDVVSVAKKISAAVAELAIPHEHGVDGKVSVSIGGATSEPAGRDISPETLYRKADQLLYKAKETGRSRYVVE